MVSLNVVQLMIYTYLKYKHAGNSYCVYLYDANNTKNLTKNHQSPKSSFLLISQYDLHAARMLVIRGTSVNFPPHIFHSYRSTYFAGQVNNVMRNGGEKPSVMSSGLLQRLRITHGVKRRKREM